MRIHIIACRVFTRELCYYASKSPNAVDITWLPQGLHDTPNELRRMITASIDSLYLQKEKKTLKHWPDYMVLSYGLCSNGVVGIESRDTPLIIPRTDDCIGVFLGSQKRYLSIFEEYNGTYWLNNGWIETAFIPSREMLDERRKEYTQLYGEENADYLLEQDKLWIKNYNTCGYINSPVYNNETYNKLARDISSDNGWKYKEIDGDSRMIRMITEGTWNEEEFCICPPFHRIEADYSGLKIRAVPIKT